MEQAPYPITLAQVYFVRSVVIAVPDHKPVEGAALPPPTNNIGVKKVEGEGRVFHAEMRTILNPEMDPSIPYSIDMLCLATLTVDDTLTDELALRGVAITAHNVLYGAIREAVAWITGRQPYGQYLLGLSVLHPQPPASPQQEEAASDKASD